MSRIPRQGSGFRRRHIAITAVASCALLAASVTAAQAASTPTPASAPVTSAAVSAPVDELIIGFESAAEPVAVETLTADVTVADVAPVAETAQGAQVVEVEESLTGAELDALIEELESVDGVAYVEPNQMLREATNDPSYPSLWGLHGPTGIDAPGAWTTSRGEGAVVAVLDTGSTSHPDLNPNYLPGYDFVSNATLARDGNGRDSNPADEGTWQRAQECVPGNPQDVARNSSWHGTHVAGTVAAVADNAIGVTGAAPDAQIVPVRVLAKCGGTTADIADAIIWASGGTVRGVPANANPADVINLSLGGDGACSVTTQNAINGAVSRGTTVVVAAGNSNVNASNFNPANCANVITVAATDIGGNRAFYSNFGTTVEVSAPGGESAVAGEGILSTLNSGTTTPSTANYREYQGTSMAAPHVAAAAAILSQTAPDLTPAQISQRLQATANPLPGTCSGGCGAGIIDVAAAVGP